MGFFSFGKAPTKNTETKAVEETETTEAEVVLSMPIPKGKYWGKIVEVGDIKMSMVKHGRFMFYLKYELPGFENISLFEYFGGSLQTTRLLYKLAKNIVGQRCEVEVDHRPFRGRTFLTVTMDINTLGAHPDESEVT